MLSPTPSETAEDENTFSLGLRLISQAELPRLDTLGLAGMIVMGDSPLPRSAAIASIPTIQIGEPEHTAREAYIYFLDSFAAGRAHRRSFVGPRPPHARFCRARLEAACNPATVGRACSPSGSSAARRIPLAWPAPYDTDKQVAGSLREQADLAVRKLYLPVASIPATPSSRPAPMPTAIVCFDEAVTAYVLQSLTRLGKSVPGDVSVVTFGDSPDGAEAMSPPPHHHPPAARPDVPRRSRHPAYPQRRGGSCQ